MTPQGRVARPAISGTHYRSAHTKTIWRDPLDINITSLVADLSWPLYEAPGTVGTKVYSYEFSWDDWSNTGQVGPYVTKSFGLYPGSSLLGNKREAEASWDWYSSAHETFYNTDFANLLKKLLVGELACTEGNKTTEFYHNIKVVGYQSNAMAYLSEDSKKGACSNLVHHVVYAGWGWDGPEHEKVGIEYHGIIASSQYEQEAEQTVGEQGLAPVVNTLAATPLHEGEVSLNGEINPEGRTTAYNFEYGPTEAYASFATEGNAGSGASPVYESRTLSGLQPGAIYHYRIFGINSGGISYGPDQTFRVPQRPTVATEPATEVQALTATLHGSVNPNELETYYDFQYGTTPSLGSTVPAEPGWDIGNATTSISCYNTATLEENTTYYYRVVAYNSMGTTYGAEQSFTTPPSLFWAYYAGSGSSLEQSWWNQSWNYTPLSQPIATGSSPVADQNPNSGQAGVYYAGTNGSIDEDYYNGSAWGFISLGHGMKAGTTPAVVHPAGSSTLTAYFVGTGGGLEEVWYNGSWNYSPLSLPVAAGSSPAADPNPGPGEAGVYYAGTNGSIDEDYYKAGAWGYISLGHGIKAGTTPAVVHPAGATQLDLFFVGPGGGLEEMWWNGSSWGYAPLGQSVAAGSSPAADPNPATGQAGVYYAGTNGSLDEMYYNGSAWGFISLGHGIQAGTTPAVMHPPGAGHLWIWFTGPGSSLEESWWNGSSWGWAPIGHGMYPGTSPTVVSNPSSNP